MNVATRAANIGAAGQRRRFTLGLIMLGVGVVAVVVLIALRVTPGWLLLAFVPFWVGALGLIQAREKT